MRIVPFHLVLILLLSLGNADGRYSEFATIKNPSAINKIAFFDNDQSFLLYGNDNAQVYFYRSYDMKPLFNATLSGKPLYLQTFVDVEDHNAIIYAVDGGMIFSRSFFGVAESDKDFKIVGIENCDLLKVSPSPDKIFFAALCADSTEVIIGEIKKLDTPVQKLKMNFKVTAFKWHPDRSSIVASGNDANDGSLHLVVYDFTTKQTTDYSDKLKDVTKIKDLQFSFDGKQLAFAQQEIIKSDLIPIFTFADPDNIQYLSGIEPTQFLELTRSGKLLTSYDSQRSFVWEFNNVGYGNYQSSFKSSGLSKTGNYLFTLNPLSKDIIGNKICQNANEVFINNALTCAICQQPCSSCFGSQDQCSSCKIAFYLDLTSFKCKACPNNCKECDSESCKTCLDGFYLDDQNVCQDCSPIFDGCLTCNARACTKCDASKNWILGFNHKCKCKAAFVEVDHECLSCPAHCSECQTVDICTTCSAEEHRKPTPIDEKCVCDVGYYDFEDACLSCMQGCLSCDNKATCAKCDAVNHWSPDKNEICVCQIGYFYVKNKCALCNSLMEGCRICSAEKICDACNTGYDLNTQTNLCVKHQDDDRSNTGLIIGIGIGALVFLAIIVFFVIRIIRRRRGKKVQTLLESQAQHQNQEQS